MNYSNNYFGKSLDNLEYQDIVNFFINPQEESNKIEFKSYSTTYGNFNRNFEGVIRGICAFLNSDGGILIWGAPEGTIPAGQSEKIFQGLLSPLNERKEKDWLINKVSDSITPLPVGINAIRLEDTNNYLYIFEIQPSPYRPHQNRNIFWARLDGQTKPAPYYLVEALFRRISYPNLEGYIKLDQISNDGHNYYLDITIFLFNFSQLQNEENVSFRLMCPEGIFSRYNDPQHQHMYIYNGHQLIFKDFIDVLHFGTPNMHNERLIFDPHDLVNNHNNEIRLLLSFGGKKSPVKTSEYKLNLNNLNWTQTDTPNYLITEIEENILIYDKQEELGTTREDTLRRTLGR